MAQPSVDGNLKNRVNLSKIGGARLLRALDAPLLISGLLWQISGNERNKN